ncbi:hypothetical protein [Demequina salsinemoris]|uniref:hypothetical protein n=1 Tax=Demequina salsinemoris TaxID=577470 RepID=UPI000781B0BF|nr:hypothetical protein [Demequina salsinemoris]
MGRDNAGADGPGGPDDGADLESTARRSPRASRQPRRSRRARFLRSRSSGAETEPAAREASLAADREPSSPPVTSAGLAPAGSPAPERTRSAYELDDDWEDLDPQGRSRDDDSRGTTVRWIMVTTLLAITVLSLTGVAIYLTDVVDQWEVRSDELTAANYDLGDKVASQKESIASLTEQIDILTNQLSTAQDSINELASQSANSDDDLAYAQQRIEILSGYASTGAAVANALSRCLDGEQQLVKYLQSPDDYDEAEVAAYADSVDELCTAARKSNSDFQALLTE